MKLKFIIVKLTCFFFLSVRAAGTVDARPVRHAAAATQHATVAPSASIRTGRSTTTSAVRLCRPSNSRPASSREAFRGQKPLLPSAPLPAPQAAALEVRPPPRLLLPLAHPPPAPRPPPPLTAHRAKRLTVSLEASRVLQPALNPTNSMTVYIALQGWLTERDGNASVYLAA